MRFSDDFYAGLAAAAGRVTGTATGWAVVVAMWFGAYYLFTGKNLVIEAFAMVQRCIG